jgi:DNA-binding Lrp family transcriptional regulator
MDEIDLTLLSELKQGIPLTPEPFSKIANKIGVKPKEVIIRLTKLKENGVIRRFGASIRPNNIGLTVNAVIAWNVPKNRVQEVGLLLSTFKEITHCYERETVPEKWEYNLYTVMHAQERETIEQAVRQLSETINIPDYIILFSKRDLKKTSPANHQTLQQTPLSLSSNCPEANQL